MQETLRDGVASKCTQAGFEVKDRLLAQVEKRES